MTTQEVRRKLTAILSAYVKGYSRLINEDEVGTIHTLYAYKEIMAGLIQPHDGRVVDTSGDNVLAEFGSVMGAVKSAIEIQKIFKLEMLSFQKIEGWSLGSGSPIKDVIK